MNGVLYEGSRAALVSPKPDHVPRSQLALRHGIRRKQREDRLVAAIFQKSPFNSLMSRSMAARTSFAVTRASVLRLLT